MPRKKRARYENIENILESDDSSDEELIAEFPAGNEHAPEEMILENLAVASHRPNSPEDNPFITMPPTILPIFLDTSVLNRSNSTDSLEELDLFFTLTLNPDPPISGRSCNFLPISE